MGDRADRVAENRRRSYQALNCDTAMAYEVWQIHSATVQIAAGPLQRDEAYRQADAIITRTPGLTLFMRFADCVPILLSDPVAGVIGLVHAGWMGTVRGTVSEAVGQMKGEFGCQPKNIVAGIGPSIGPDHYEVGEDVVAQVENAFLENTNRIIHRVGAKTYLDLWRANEILLQQAGVGEIEISDICTGCHVDDWYSHRIESGKTGRFGALIALQ